MAQLTPYLALDSKAQQLVDQRDGSVTSLSYSEAQILNCLLEKPESIFSKEDLLAVGWPDRVVALTSLTQCISTLRKKLEPYPEIQLKTVARRGYELTISENSSVHLLAINDGRAIRKALVGVSLPVKIFGITLLVLALSLWWYFSDAHTMLKQVHHWQADKQILLNVGGAHAVAPLYYLDGVDSLHPSMWQKHLAPEGNRIEGMEHFGAFASTDGHNYSFAICPGADTGDCAGEGIINITAMKPEPAGLNMQQFIPLSKQMEQRIRYNRIILPPAGSDGEVTEHNYHADIYFPVAGELLVRTDLNMSLVYESEDRGQFYFSACLTDQDCITTPIKYRLRGHFRRYHRDISGHHADVFQVHITQKELIKPENVSHSAMDFYREIRKHDIRDEELFFYRIHQDRKTAVWLVPLMGNIVAWTNYSQVSL
ncbi:winged helix-turn-helix domain-containing protein [Shewanella sp. YIC-542]|uniref:winged helix-turn-helix domain-containing protein n=1 Tax=Shewanella mytili TaxID=3377111 RepID=UPI00398F5A24